MFAKASILVSGQRLPWGADALALPEWLLPSVLPEPAKAGGCSALVVDPEAETGAPELPAEPEGSLRLPFLQWRRQRHYLNA
jgi:hypothetical protein